MVEIRVGSWWRSRLTDKIATVIAVRNDLVTALWPDGSSGYVTTKIFLRDFKHLPHCTGFGWVPVSRWFVPTRGGFLGGTLVVEQDQYGKVFAHSVEGKSEELTVYQHGLLDKLVQQKDWREIPEPEAAAILEKARKSEPKDRYYQNPSGFKNGTLFRLRDKEGCVWSILSGGQKRMHGKWQEHHDRYVAQGLWVEVTEDFVNRTISVSEEKETTVENPRRYFRNPECDCFQHSTRQCDHDAAIKQGWVEITKEEYNSLCGMPLPKSRYFIPDGIHSYHNHHGRLVPTILICTTGDKCLCFSKAPTHGGWSQEFTTGQMTDGCIEISTEEAMKILHPLRPLDTKFPDQENDPKQETAKPTFWHVKLGNGDVSTYYGSSVDGKCVMLIRREEHGLEPGTMVNFDYNKKFPKLQADDILIEGSPAMFGILSRAIGLCASNTALRRNAEAKTCSGCDCGV